MRNKNKHKAYIKLILSKMPEGIKRGGTGYACEYCGAFGLNTKIAMDHNCKRYMAKFKRNVKNLKTSAGGFHRQILKNTRY